jgi:hypothetical protein
MKHQKRWFINRIGKLIYRNRTSCNCKCTTCERVYKKGLTITCLDHATYLYTIQYDLNIDYQDKPIKNG